MSLIHRELSEEIQDMAESYPVITVIGPRQSGKTTLVRALFPSKPYVSLEDIDERMLAEQDPRGFLKRFPTGAIFDEIQRQPQLLSYLQGIVDQCQDKGRYILTGSHQLALHQAISQSLAGRTAILKLMPLSMQELCQVQPEQGLDEYLFQGQFPRIYSEALNPTKYYRDYVQTYVERDVRQLINIKDLSQFQNFLKLCAGRVGQIINFNELSNALGLSSNTIKQWLSVLEASFIVFRLPPYFENFGKRIIKSPKLYFTDVGLATYLLDIHDTQQLARDPLHGGLVENLMVSELFKRHYNQGKEPSFYYYRDSNQNEIDIIYKRGHSLTPIEIKSSYTFNPRFLKGLRYFKNLVGSRCETGYLIYAGEQEQTIDSFNVINFKKTALILN